MSRLLHRIPSASFSSYSSSSTSASALPPPPPSSSSILSHQNGPTAMIMVNVTMRIPSTNILRRSSRQLRDIHSSSNNHHHRNITSINSSSRRMIHNSHHRIVVPLLHVPNARYLSPITMATRYRVERGVSIFSSSSSASLSIHTQRMTYHQHEPQRRLSSSSSLHHIDGNHNHNFSTDTSSSSSSPTTITTTTNGSTRSRLDGIPIDLSDVVQRIITYLELHHEDQFIRARFLKNLEHATRFKIDGSAYHYQPQSSIIPDTTSSHNTSTTTINGHHPTTTAAAPTLMSTHDRINGSSHHDTSVSEGLNGINGHSVNGSLNGIHNPMNDHQHTPINGSIHNGYSSEVNGIAAINGVHGMNGYDTSISDFEVNDAPWTLSFEDSISDLVSTGTPPTSASQLAPNGNNHNNTDIDDHTTTNSLTSSSSTSNTSDVQHSMNDWNKRILNGIRGRKSSSDHADLTNDSNQPVVNSIQYDTRTTSQSSLTPIAVSGMVYDETTVPATKATTTNIHPSNVTASHRNQLSDEPPLTFPRPLLDRMSINKEESESCNGISAPLANNTNNINNNNNISSDFQSPSSPLSLNGKHEIQQDTVLKSSHDVQTSHQKQQQQQQEQAMEEVAIYHALKNDYQPGGHVERIVTLPTKTEPKPFHSARRLDSLLAVTSDSFDRNENGAFNMPTTNNSDVDRTQSSTEAKLYSTILSSSFLSSISNTTEARQPNGSNDYGAHKTTSVFHELDGREIEDEFHPQTSMSGQLRNEALPVPNEHELRYLQQQQQQQQQQQRDETMHNSALFNVYASAMVSKPVEDQSLQSWFKADFLETYKSTNTNSNTATGIPNSVSASLLQEKGSFESSDGQNLQGWFKSEFTEGMHRERPVNGLSIVDTSEVPFIEANMLEQARLKSLTEAVVLLRSLTEDQWVCFDLGIDKGNVADDSHKPNGLSGNSAINGFTSTPSNENIRIVDMLADILKADIFNGGKPLTSTDYNYSLARMAIATDVAPDEILALLMQTHSQMNELGKAGFRESEPNSITHEILLLVLVRRFSAFHNAIDLIVSLSKDPHFQWSPKTLQAASELCERKDLLRMSRDLTKVVKTFDISRLKIPKRVFISLINVYKDNDSRSDAIEMLKVGLKQTAGRSDQLLDEIFVHAIKWPYKNRLSGFIDNSSMLADIVSLLENETLYVAGFHVWKQLIYTSSFGATKIPTRYDFIVKAFRYLSVAEPMYHPDHQLLRQGLVACDVLTDSDLVWDLLRRAIINYSPSNLQVSSSDLHLKPHVPFQNFITGMTICLKENNITACEKILQVSKKIEMTPTNRRTLNMLLLKGYANTGDWENALKTIETMNAENLNPDEECYGALFYAFAMSKQVDKARAMLEEMESGTSPIRPGPTCYDGFILACARGRAWDDILASYEKMQVLHIPLSSASSHGVLLAAAKVGNRSKVKQYVQSFVTSRAQLHGDGAMLALRILLNGIVIGSKDTHDELTLDEIRDRLRILGQTQPALQEPCLNLIRSLRIAESEESRPPPQVAVSSGGDHNHSDRRHTQRTKIVPAVPMTYIMDRRHVAWRNMLTDLLLLSKAIEDGLESSSSQDTNKVEHI